LGVCVFLPCDELITRPRSPTECVRYRKTEGRPRSTGAVVPRKKNVCWICMRRVRESGKPRGIFANQTDDTIRIEVWNGSANLKF
jgi:hypothetical protein